MMGLLLHILSYISVTILFSANKIQIEGNAVLPKELLYVIIVQLDNNYI